MVAQARSQYGELAPEDVALVLARAKCEAVAARWPVPSSGDADGALVVGCDSVLELDGEVHGKPADAAEALAPVAADARALRGAAHRPLADRRPRRRGRRHRRDARRRGLHDGALRRLSDDEIEAYVATGEPLQVAGAFTLDGLGGPYVDGIEGDPRNVVGICLPLLRELLGSLDVPWSALRG